MRIAILTTDNRGPFQDYANPVPHFGTAPEALLQGFAQIPEVDVHVVSCIRRQIRTVDQIAPNIRFHSLFVPKIGWMRTLYQGCIRATRRKLREIQPDIVHGQGTEYDGALSAALSGFPNVTTIHGNMRLIAKVNKDRPFTFGWLAARLEAFALPRTGGVICITQYTQDAVAPLAKRTWIVPNAVDARFFDVQPEPESPPVVLCVGNICLRKNQNRFIRALDPLAQRTRFKLIFIGRATKGSDYDDEFFGLLKTRSWCAYEGFADRAKLRDYLRCATLVTLPSLEDNCPMAVLEAMAAGVPVVAAKVGGVPDLIEEDRTGYFCDPLNADSMRAAIERGLANRAATHELARLARQRARERFHPLVIARRHVEIYREVLGRVGETTDRATLVKPNA